MSYIGNPISIMDYPVDYFTGDGTSTTFQLSRIPASATSILVHIGGVKQVASTTDPAYYLDGSKLVFVSPPGAYSPIEVNYLGIAGQVNIPGVQSVTQDMLSLQLANTFVYQTTANGATASFTLNAPPVSANSLVVSANGVVQYDYSVNGNNLTFGFTPPAGTLVRATALALAQAGVPADGSVTSVKLGANLTITGNTTFDGFSGAGARIRGDFSNATLSNRLSFQTSTTNSGSRIGVLPNGTGSSTSFDAFSNPDPTSTAFGRFGIIGGSEVTVQSTISGSGTYLPLTMYTGGSERMRIDTSGNVGIGTASATRTFQVNGTSSISGQTFIGTNSVVTVNSVTNHPLQVYSAVARTTIVRTSANSNGAGIFLAKSRSDNPHSSFAAVNSGDQLGVINFYGDDGTSLATPTSSIQAIVNGTVSTGSVPTDLVFYSGSGGLSERMRITSGGDVGIGPNSSNRLNLTYDGTGGGATIGPNSTGGSTFLTFGTSNAGTYAERMRIDSSGNVGIGGSSSLTSAGLTTIRPSGSNSGFRLLSGSSWTDLVQNDGSGLNINNTANSPMAFGTNNTERMRITSGGNLLLGTTFNASRLTVSNGNSTRSGITITDGDTASLMMFAGASTNAVIAVDANSLVFKTGATAGQDDGTERMRIDSGGRVTMPFQPAFHVLHGEGTAPGRPGTAEWTEYGGGIVLNRGNHLSGTRFTAPVSGVYYFSFSAQEETFYGSWGSPISVAFWINGSIVYRFGLDNPGIQDASNEEWISAQFIISLSAGDFVSASVYAPNASGGGGNFVSTELGSGGFMGYLIG